MPRVSSCDIVRDADQFRKVMPAVLADLTRRARNVYYIERSQTFSREHAPVCIRIDSNMRNSLTTNSAMSRIACIHIRFEGDEKLFIVMIRNFVLFNL